MKKALPKLQEIQIARWPNSNKKKSINDLARSYMVTVLLAQANKCQLSNYVLYLRSLQFHHMRSGRTTRSYIAKANGEQLGTTGIIL